MAEFNTNPKRIAIIGAGQRGRGFAHHTKQLNYLAEVVSVAEPNPTYREELTKSWNIPRTQTFSSWQDFASAPKLCDAVVISTMDRDHAGPAIACLNKGYDLLLEKPMGISLQECRDIEQTQCKSGRIVAVCHSLRYQKGFRKVKELLSQGVIGRVISLDLLEQVGFLHQAHSYVRGNWGNEFRSSPMLLAKSCHDLDYISFIVDQPCLQVSSFGSLSYFTRANAPKGSAERCTEGCAVEPSCPYSAIKQYVLSDRTSWPAYIISPDHSYEAHLKAIQEGPYGRCVWKCDNDVVDHQVVSMLFANDITATFTMTGFTRGGGRRLRVHGTEGELSFNESTIEIRTFADQNTTEIKLGHETGGHGGGDLRVLREWLQALHTGDTSQLVANAQESLKTHTIVFAAEMSRKESRTVQIKSL